MIHPCVSGFGAWYVVVIASDSGTENVVDSTSHGG